MSGKFNPREMLKRTFSSGSSKTIDNDEAPRSPLKSPLKSPLIPPSPSSNPRGISPFIPGSSEAHVRVPSLRSVPEGLSESTSNPLGIVHNARIPDSGGSRFRDIVNSRNANNNAHNNNANNFITSMANNNPTSPPTGPPMGMTLNFPKPASAPPAAGGSAMALKMSGIASRRGLKMKLSEGMGGAQPAAAAGTDSFAEFRDIINPEEGWLTFNGAAKVTRDGVRFANGTTYRMSLDEIESLGELGRGNYGTVYKVRHAKNRQPKIGLGLAGRQAARGIMSHATTDPSTPTGTNGQPESAMSRAMNKNRNKRLEDSMQGLTGMVMAMKEIRMEMEKTKFKTIAKELLILHQCASPYIIDFYGAFLQDGFVYMCIEYMDGGSIDRLYSQGIPEDVLQHITLATVLGLNELKEKHNIIHRDVKPTNILVNTRGQVKICDFGVSGDLVASKARTNIGCQSYMPPERINSSSMAGISPDLADETYGVQSDIWSLGLSLIECALGKYPYENSDSILVQLSAIVSGEAPTLPTEGFSAASHDFVNRCLAKTPQHRPGYSALLTHPWLASLVRPATIPEVPELSVDGDVEMSTEAPQPAQVMGPPMQGRLGTAGSHVQQPDDKLVSDWVKKQLARNVAEAVDGTKAEPAVVR